MFVCLYAPIAKQRHRPFSLAISHVSQQAYKAENPQEQTSSGNFGLAFFSLNINIISIGL